MKVMQELWKRYKTVDKFDASYWEGVAVAMIMERAMIRASEKFKEINRETHQPCHGILPNRRISAA